MAIEKLGVMCYQCLNITFNLIIDFWMPFSFFKLAHRLFPTLMALSFDLRIQHDRYQFFLNIKYVGEQTQRFPSTCFYFCLGYMKTSNDNSDFIWSINHSSIYNIPEVLLVITLTSMLIYIFMLFKHLCSTEGLLLNDWSTPIVFIWSSRLGDCNISSITTNCCSNVSMEGI